MTNEIACVWLPPERTIAQAGWTTEGLTNLTLDMWLPPERTIAQTGWTTEGLTNLTLDILQVLDEFTDESDGNPDRQNDLLDQMTVSMARDAKEDTTTSLSDILQK
jgi:hypothetical protein